MDLVYAKSCLTIVAGSNASVQDGFSAIESTP